VEALANKPEILPFTLGTGKSLPYDAGRYVMCRSYNFTRYFLVKMNGHVPSQPATIPMEMGFCVPEVCDSDGIVDLVSSETVQTFIPLLYLPQLHMSMVSDITATSPDIDFKYADKDAGCLAACAVCCSLAFLVVASTGIVLVTETGDTQASGGPVVQQPRPSGSLEAQGQQLLNVEEGAQPAREIHRRAGWQQKLASTTITKAFSLVGKSGTLNKLVEKSPYKPTDCLNGIRVISMAWIIMGHTFLMPNGISGYANQEDIISNPLNSAVAEANPFFQIITGSQTGVDAFFFLSGFLLSHLTLKEIRVGRLKVIFAVILRYVRLTPSLALVMLVYYKMWIFLGDGPFAVNFQRSIDSRCADSWWSELTYTMNFIPFDSDKVCMGWTWYLGDDMIFFILTILILPVYHRMRLAAWAIVAALIGLSFGVTSWLVVKHHLGLYVFDSHYTAYSYWAYSKPYSRIPAYLVGVVAAWILEELERRGITRETRSTTATARMLANLTAGLCLIVLVFTVAIPCTDFGTNKNSWGDLANVLYINLSRPVVAACLAIITLLCYYDYLPLINGVLSHPNWTPLARLTYGAYLVHPLVIKLAAARSVQYYSFNGMDIFYRWVGNCVCATIGSIALWVLCERPCMTIFSPARKTRAQRPGAEATSECPGKPALPVLSLQQVG
jgi:peptidoglycan/LPS O-acetylase OafA/YrhL